MRNLERNLSWVLLLTLTVMLSVQIVARYLFYTTFSWIEEFSRVVFIWFIYLSISWIIIQGRHVRVNVLQYFLPKSFIKPFYFFADLLWLIFNLVMTYAGYLFLESEMNPLQRTATLEIPEPIIHAIIPIGFGLMSVRLILYMYRVYVKKEPEIIFDTEKTDEED